MPDYTYNTIEKPAQAEFKDRGSKFIAYAYPIQSVDEFKIHLNALKKEHLKAVHYCFAYRIGTDGNNFRVSDDGEPSSSAGRPILGQIDSRELTNILIIVVRYFGGTLLGVPGLINAYKTSAAVALKEAIVTQKSITANLTIQFDYSRMNEVMQIFRKYKCEIIKGDSALFCNYLITVPVKNLEQLKTQIKSLKGIEVIE